MQGGGGISRSVAFLSPHGEVHAMWVHRQGQEQAGWGVAFLGLLQ